jgi:hypothetical protein
MEQRSLLLLPRVAGTGDNIDISGSALVNLNLVRRVEIVSTTEIILWFNATDAEIIQGSAATILMQTLLQRAISLTGQPVELQPGDDTLPSASPEGQGQGS